MTSIAASSSSNGAGVATAIILAVIGVLVWLVPIMIALIRHVPNTGSVIVIDLLTGWTLVGWVVALAMACRSHPRPQAVVPTGWQPPGN
jgi:hypothetical protein